MHISQPVKQICTWIGAVIFVGGYVLDFLDVVNLLGWNPNAWQLMGAILFVVSLLAIVSSYEKGAGVAGSSTGTTRDGKALPELTKPEPQFGCPFPEGQKDHESWWHIPIWLKEVGNSDMTSYEHCRAKLIIQEAKFFSEPQLSLRCQSDRPQGDAEFALRLGEEPKKLPIAIRNEIPDKTTDSCLAYFTDEGYLQHNVRQPRLESGTYKFKLEIRHEKLRWESSSYMLTVPGPRMSNGKFTLSKLPG